MNDLCLRMNICELLQVTDLAYYDLYVLDNYSVAKSLVLCYYL